MLKNENRPGYKKTKVGWIPDDWKCVPFATVFDLKMVSLAPTPSEKYREIGVRSHGKGIFHKPPVTGESLGDKRVFHCQPGALVFNIVFAWEQAVAVLSESERGFIASHRFPMFHGRKNLASEAYYLLFFKTRRGKEQLTIASPGGAGRNKTLGQSDLEVLPVPCPPFSEQIAIAEVLACWDKAVQTLELKIKKKRLVKQGLMQKLLSSRTRLPGFVKPWKDVRLGNILSIGNGKDYKHLAKGTVPVFGTGGLMTYVNDKLHSGETVFIGRKGTINKPFYFNGDFWTVDTLFFTHKFKNVLPKFVFFLFQRINWEKHSEASGVPSLSKTVILKLKAHIPPLEEQRAIAKVLSAADGEIEALERKLALFKDQKKYLLNNLVTGTIRLPQFENSLP
ncbi:MAG: restriction endonuclease subunit S [Eubacteriales bacterium]|nr:restriction endonuclease subunit S [Eubacteriales bacterium]